MRMGNLLIYSAAEIFCIWRQAPPRCRRSRATRGRKPIRRDRSALSSAFRLAEPLTARLMAQWLSDWVGQQFVIENRPGAASNIATETVISLLSSAAAAWSLAARAPGFHVRC